MRKLVLARRFRLEAEAEVLSGDTAGHDLSVTADPAPTLVRLPQNDASATTAAICLDSCPPCQAIGELPSSSTTSRAPGIAAA